VDSIRDNDGWYYRLAEVYKAQQKVQGRLEVLVVLGPGFPGEDYRQTEVPLAMIMTKQGSSEILAKKHLLPGNRLVKLEELIQDEEYLKSLDTTGWTAEQAGKAVGKLRKVV